jgi:hypothetical protein
MELRQTFRSWVCLRRQSSCWRTSEPGYTSHTQVALRPTDYNSWINQFPEAVDKQITSSSRNHFLCIPACALGRNTRQLPCLITEQRATVRTKLRHWLKQKAVAPRGFLLGLPTASPSRWRSLLGWQFSSPAPDADLPSRSPVHCSLFFCCVKVNDTPSATFLFVCLLV